MPHQLATTFEVELDRPRRLKFDMNSVAEYSRWTGLNVLGGDNPLGTVESSETEGTPAKFHMDPVRLRALVAACLLHEDPQYDRTGVPLLAPHKVGALITASNLGAVTDAAMRAFCAYFGRTLEDLAEPTTNPTTEAAASPLASSNSGPSGGMTSGSASLSSGA